MIPKYAQCLPNNLTYFGIGTLAPVNLVRITAKPIRSKYQSRLRDIEVPQPALDHSPHRPDVDAVLGVKPDALTDTCAVEITDTVRLNARNLVGIGVD